MAADEFDAIEASRNDVTFGGEVFTISPLTIDRLPAFARAVRPIMPAISELDRLDENADPGYVSDTLLELVSEHGELLHEAVAIAVAADKAGIPAQRARTAKLDAAEFLLLAMAVVKANTDFFARRLLPLLLQVRQEAKLGAGQTPSSP